MRLRFDMALVRELLDHSRASAKHGQTYGETGQGYGLWLVGEEGVYLMSNGQPGLLLDPATTQNKVCQSEETKDPATQDENKRAIFGGDDGVEFLPGANLDAVIKTEPSARFLALNMTANAIEVITMSPSPKRKAPARPKVRA